MANRKEASSWELQGYLGKGATILGALGYDYIPDDHNPIWQALSGLAPWTMDELQPAIDVGEITEEEAERLIASGEANAALADKLRPHIWRGKSPNKTAILRGYAVCQTAALNQMNGPVATGALATLRQRWYASANPSAMGFKFAAQALERYLIRSADVVLVDDQRSYDRASKQGAKRIEYKVNWSNAKALEIAKWIVAADPELDSDTKTIIKIAKTLKVHKWPKNGWGRVYAQTHSQLLADLVRSGLTYEELWVKDASREIMRYAPLYPEFYGVFLLEKEGVFEHFQPFCQAAGIPILISMSGNNAFSGVEFVLNENFRDYDGNYKPTPENPLHIFSLTDHDYAGHVPVQDGAVSQFARYLPGAVQLHRVGVTPEIVRETGRTILEAGYIFEHDYNRAYQEWADEYGVWIGDDCYGIEIEALTPYALYMPYLIDAIVRACGGDEILRERLAKMAEADWWMVNESIKSHTCDLSELIRRLVALQEWANGEQSDRRYDVGAQTSSLVGEEWNEQAWRNQEEVGEKAEEVVAKQTELIDFEKYTEFVQEGNGYSKWNPVSSDAASAAVVQVFRGGWSKPGEGIETAGLGRFYDIDELRDRIREDEIEVSEAWPWGREWELEDIAENLDADHDDLVSDLNRVFSILSDHGLEL